MLKHLQLDERTRRLYIRHENRWLHCERCEIGKSAFNHVFGRGTLPCDVLLVGEGPGRTENSVGIPFCGRSGRLLNAALESIKFPFSYAITNAIACRPIDPLGSSCREPAMHELSNCVDRLQSFISLARPKGILAMGAIPFVHLQDLGFHPYRVTHPSWVLRQGGIKSDQFKLYCEELHHVIKEFME